MSHSPVSKILSTGVAILALVLGQAFAVSVSADMNETTAGGAHSFQQASITGGADQTCVLMATGAVKCWGSNNKGQLGDNTLVDKKTHGDVVGLTSGVGLTTTTIAAATTTIAATTSVAPATTTTLNITSAPREQVVLNLPTSKTPLLAETSLSSGTSVSLTYSGFTPGEFVQLIVASTPQVISSGYADSKGSITLSGRVPASLSLGNHSLALYAPVSGHGVRQIVSVTSSAGSLPATGASTTSQLPMTAALLLSGLMLVIIARRRSTRNPT